MEIEISQPANLYVGSDLILKIIPQGEGNAPLSQISQRDKRWRYIPLGHSTQYTIGSAGCALCCATMISRLIEPNITPVELQNRLLPIGGFWQANLNWAKVPDAVPGLVFEGAVNWEQTNANMELVYNRLEQAPQILWVDFHPGGAHNTHFVVATHRIGDDDIYIVDPWDGYAGGLMLRYAADNWDLARAIYGIRTLRVLDEPISTNFPFSVAEADKEMWLDNWPDEKLLPCGAE